MQIGVVQENYLIGDFAGNAKKIEQAILSLLQKNSSIDFFVTSEMSLWGYPPQDLLCIPEKIDSALQELEKLCSRLPEVCFLVGLATKNKNATGKGLYNTMVLCQGGAPTKFFHKCLLPNYGVFDDKRYFQAAEFCNYFELAGQKIGVAICEDLCYQKNYNLFQNYTDRHLKNFHQLDLIINPSSSPYHKGKIDFRKNYLQKISQHFACPVLFVNQVGGNDSLIFDGSSVFIDQGKILHFAPSFEPAKMILDSGKKKSVIFNRKDWEKEASEAIILGVRDYFYKTGFQKALLGLSGGIDSALTLFFAVRALGNENVSCFLMPSPYSSEHSISDAKELAKTLKVNYRIVCITKIIESFSESLGFVLKNSSADETQENIQTRIRGTLLMAVANRTKSLLLTTGNKSEIFAGYCTLYGDMCGSLNPIGDLKKTEVYAICHYFQKKENIFPVNILTKAPSAELKENQTDQEKLPPYENLDQILEKLVLENKTTSALNKQFSSEVAQKVNNLFQISEYKRKQAPPILHISSQAFGIGWRMPLARKW